jgi:hypothetical protein
MKAKIVCCCVENHGNNIVQGKDNNAIEADKMASILWDIIVS